ncbi:RHS repeat-associated core domain-containing protein [Pseudomonas sp. NPDC007930]|uniref:RHS repeat-associated core domain-containing protein n=1 Tax=Pseudomonas sp. NPDC007930 TaxID=3364417 RepID=UPI0036ED3DCE
MLLATDALQTPHVALAGGEAAASPGTPWGHGFTLLRPGFQGGYLEPCGGYLLGHGYRLYLPRLGRFNRPDSLSPFGRGGGNAYAFCQGDPVNHADPSGHVKLSAAFLKAQAIFGQAAKAKPTLVNIGDDVFSLIKGHLDDAAVMNLSATSRGLSSRLARERSVVIGRAIARDQAWTNLAVRHGHNYLEPFDVGQSEMYSPLGQMYASRAWAVAPEEVAAAQFFTGLDGVGLRTLHSRRNLQGPLPANYVAMQQAVSHLRARSPGIAGLGFDEQLESLRPGLRRRDLWERIPPRQGRQSLNA